MAFKIQPKKTMITSVFTDTLHLKWQIFCCKNKLCWHPREVNKSLPLKMLHTKCTEFCMNLCVGGSSKIHSKEQLSPAGKNPR